MKLSEVTGPISYTNTYQKEQQTYDPRTAGSFAIVLVGNEWPELSPDVKGNRRHLQLAMGSVGTPHRDIEAAIADLALTLAEFPEAKDKLKLVKLPCVFSSRDGWVDVDFTMFPELTDLYLRATQDAKETAQKSKAYGGPMYRDEFKRKYGIGGCYF